MSLVLILAAGEHDRFPSNTPKQLLKVPGTDETIIGRICRQVITRNQPQSIFVVSHEEQIECHIDSLDAGIDVIIPMKRRVTSETMWCTRTMWAGTTIILLGDVIYSKACMNQIFQQNGPFLCFGNSAEIFALKFQSSRFKAVEAAALKAVDAAEGQRQGKLRHLYRAYCGFPMFQDEPMAVERLPHWPGVPLDYTRDIDTLWDYERLEIELSGKHRLDDLP